MVSFQARLASGLEKRGISTSFDLDDPSLAAILVIGGTRRLPSLIHAHQRGVRIVQRLNGMNWLHRHQPTPLKRFLTAEVNNALLAMIRRLLADRIAYQSQFSQSWWERVYGKLDKPQQVIYNGVDLDTFTDQGSHQRPTDHFRVLLVEGHLDQTNRQGLDQAIDLVEGLRSRVSLPVELVVAGDVAPALQNARPDVTWKGVVRRDDIPALDRSAHLLYSADLNAACPNSVIEALACGLPVVAFDTGALAELVTGKAGQIVPYGSNHWILEPPVLPPLIEVAQAILLDNPAYRPAARQQAVEKFGLDLMVDGYLNILLG